MKFAVSLFDMKFYHKALNMVINIHYIMISQGYLLCNNDKLVYLMRNEIKALSTFLQEAWKIRQESLYV